MRITSHSMNFTKPCTLVHRLLRRVYVTVNAFARDAELRELPAMLHDLSSAGADALIVSDPGVLMLARETLPNMELHLSTQANTLNARTARFWHDQGVKRIVLARELTLKEVAALRAECPPDMELELFVHGAMVHFLFGPLLAKQLPQRAGFQPR